MSDGLAAAVKVAAQKVLQQKALLHCFDFLGFHPDDEWLVEGPALALFVLDRRDVWV